MRRRAMRSVGRDLATGVRTLLRRAGRDESGAAAIEYSLIAAIISVAVIASMNALDYDAAFEGIASAVSSAFDGL